MKKTYIAPSILSADFAEMGKEVQNIEKCGADLIHCDVMDGVFVPNITFGIKMVADLRKRTNLPLDCHLMIINPEKYVEDFKKAGADYITVHYEACKENTAEVLKKISSMGVKCGVVINPDTSADKIIDLLPLCDMVLVMTVEPGYGGQGFIPQCADKVAMLRKYCNENGFDKMNIQVDGGINTATAATVKDAGANVLVAGTYLFRAEDMRAAADAIR